ncbi:MAG: hypothetical protein ABIY48_05855 [Acidimicrobiales bacterium]
MPRRLLALAVAVLAILGATGCADSVSPAARIGDVKIGNDAFLAEVAEWVGNPAAIDPTVLGEPNPGTYPLDLVRQLLQQRIEFELHHQEFDHLGLKLDDAMRQQGLASIFGDPAAAEGPFKGFSKAFAASFTDDVARQLAVQTKLGDTDYTAWHTKAQAQTPIEISPRYGTWDPATGQITPPKGPTQPVSTVTAGQ